MLIFLSGVQARFYVQSCVALRRFGERRTA